jgi:hypothetical protein
MIMALNGTEWINNPWGKSLEPFTNIFQESLNNGGVFYIFIIIVLAFAIYKKTDEPIFAMMFLVGSGAILSMGSFMAGVQNLGMLMTVFTAIGLTILVVSIAMQAKR